MSVIKYRATDGTIKPVGVAGVSSVNGKKGAVTGVYMQDNPPPYPVTSVNGKNGEVVTVVEIDAPVSAENDEYNFTIPAKTCCLLINALKPFATDDTTLPAGNEDGITISSSVYPGEFLAGYFNRGYIMCKDTYVNDTKSVINYKNFGSNAYYLKYGFNILFVNYTADDLVFTIKGYY